MKNFMGLILGLLVPSLLFGATSPPLYRFTVPLSISNGLVSMTPASITDSGYLTTGVQSLAGAKTWTGAAQFDAAVNGNISFGAPFFKSSAANTAASSTFRAPNGGGLAIRNFGNSADLVITTDASNNLLYNGLVVSTSAAGVLGVAGGGTGLSSFDSGDLMYASGASTLAKLGISGTSNMTLVSNGSVPAWSLLANANISGSAAVAYSKLNLVGSIVNADVSGSAAVAYSKLSLVGSIVNADVSGSAAVAYSKLNLVGSIVNADVAAGAAIAYSKLNLVGSIVNADVAVGAAIAVNKIAAVTANRVLLSDASGFVTPSSVTNTTLAFLDPTSSIQTQLDGKQATGSYITALTGDVTAAGPGSVAGTVAFVGGYSAANVAAGATLANAATDANTISAIVKRNGSGNFSAGTITANLTGNASGTAATFTGSLTGDVTSTAMATSIASSVVTGKLITGYASGAGTVAGTDTILQAINKLNGNALLLAPLASPTFTGTVTMPSGSVTSSAWTTGTSPLSIGTTPATAGELRLPNNGTGISFRNAANSANVTLGVDGSNNWRFYSGSIVSDVGGLTIAGAATLQSTLAVTGTSAFTGISTFTGGTASTSAITGQAVITGGLGVSGATWIGGLANIAGAATLQSTLAVTGTSAFTGTVTMPSGSITSTIWNIGAAAGTSTHVVNGRLSLIHGGAGNGAIGNILLSDIATDATTKNAGMSQRHYTNAEENVGIFGSESTSSTSVLYLGTGGTSAQNAMTNIQFWTAATSTTTLGTVKGSLSAAGLWTLGASAGTQTHAVNGSVQMVTGAASGGLQITDSTTDATDKQSVISINHKTSAEEPVVLLYGSMGFGSANTLYIGGGAGSNFNALTAINFYTATDTITTGGTLRGGIDTNGKWTLGTSGGTQAHVVNGSLFATSSLTVGGNTTGDSNLGTISSVAFDKYYEGSFSMTFTGPFTSSQVVTVRYRKVGKTVTLQIPAVYAACSVATSIVSSAAVPTGVDPYATFQQTINASDNTVKLDTGWVRFQQGNVINIFKNAAAASFAATGSCGWEYALNFSYITN